MGCYVGCYVSCYVSCYVVVVVVTWPAAILKEGQSGSVFFPLRRAQPTEQRVCQEPVPNERKKWTAFRPFRGLSRNRSSWQTPSFTPHTLAVWGITDACNHVKVICYLQACPDPVRLMVWCCITEM